ncbi:MAG: type VI secretion system ATPase TssH, partial [Candidatus Methylomirabilales bacterium]
HLIQEMSDEEKIRERIWDTLRAHFRPEFLNRIDEVIIFHRLGMREITQIVEIQLRQLARRLAERKMQVTLSEAAKQQLAEVGFDPVYGARPLKRALQRLVLDPLAAKILEGEFKEGDHVVVDAEGDRIVFTKAVGVQRSK